MMAIVAHHYLANSGLGQKLAESPVSASSVFLYLFGAWGKTGINCFVLITGYYMCRSMTSPLKFLKLVFEVFFYHIVICLVFFLSGYEPFSMKRMIGDMLPFRGLDSNFVTCYVVFYLLIPYVNILIENITQKQMKNLIMILLFTYTIVGSVPMFEPVFNYVSWFFVIYMIGAYLRIYSVRWSMGVGVGLFMISLVFSAASILMVIYGDQLFHYGKEYCHYFVSDSNKIFAVTTAVLMFLIFIHIKIPYSRFINAVGASTFGILLIHANSGTMRRWLWMDTLDNVGAFENGQAVWHSIVSVLAVFSVCSVIDMLRIIFIEKPLFNILSKVAKLQKWNYTN